MYSAAHTNFLSFFTCTAVRMLLLYASETAACIGRHRYQSAHSAILKVWQRVDPKNYQKAVQRCNVSIKDAATQVAELKVDVSAATTCDHSKAASELKEVMAQPIVKADEDAVQASRALLCSSRNAEDAQAKLLVQCTPKDTVLNPQTEVKMREAVHDIVKDHAAGKDVTRQIKEVVELPVIKDAPAVAEAVRSVVYTTRGSTGEDSAVQSYCKTTGNAVTMRNDKFYKTILSSTAEEFEEWCSDVHQSQFDPDEDIAESLSVMIGGRVDGISSGKVVETKCRQNRFFKYIPDYELVQIMCYMKLTGLDKCDLVQKLGDKVQIKQYSFDEEKWNGIALACIQFAQQLQMVIRHPWIQDQLLSHT
jgi:Rieske Fe-S protein